MSMKLTIDKKLKTPLIHDHDEVIDNQTNITALSGDVTSNTTDLYNLSGEINNNSTDIQTVSSQVDVNDSDIDYLSGQISGNTSYISDLSGDWSYGDTLEIVYSPTSGYTETNNSLSSHLVGITTSFIARPIKGFDRLNSASLPDVAINNTTRTLRLSVKSGSNNFSFYSYNKKFTKTSEQSVVWGTASGTYYFYFDSSGTLNSIAASGFTHDIFVQAAICGIVYYNATTGEAWVGQGELHGMRMDSETHWNMHNTRHLKWSRGGLITGLADASNTYTSVSEGKHFDEDITVTALSATSHKWLYRSGADGDWTLSSTADNNVMYMNGSVAQYNEWDGSTWKLTDCTNATDYVLTDMLRTNLIGMEEVKIVGQQIYSSRLLARKAMKYNLQTINFEGLPSTEAEFQFVWIGKKDGTLEDDGNGHPYYDLRGVAINEVSE